MGHYIRENLGALNLGFQAGTTGITAGKVAKVQTAAPSTTATVTSEKGTSLRRDMVISQISKAGLTVEYQNWVFARLKDDYGSLKNSPYPVSGSYINTAISRSKEIDKPNLIRKHLSGKGLTTQEIIWIEASLISRYGSLIASPYPISSAYINTVLAGERAKIAAISTASEAKALADKLDKKPVDIDEMREASRSAQSLSYQQEGKKPLGLIFVGVGVIGLGALTFAKMRKRKR